MQPFQHDLNATFTTVLESHRWKIWNDYRTLRPKGAIYVALLQSLLQSSFARWQANLDAYATFITNLVGWEEIRELTGSICLKQRLNKINHLIQANLVMLYWISAWLLLPACSCAYVQNNSTLVRYCLEWFSIVIINFSTQTISYYHTAFHLHVLLYQSVSVTVMHWFTCWYEESSGRKSLLVCSNCRLKWGSLWRRLTHHGGE